MQDTYVIKNNDVTLHWDITGACNLHCVHCYNSSKKNTSELDYISKIEAIHKIKKLGVISHVHLLGGEPFVDSSVLKIIEECILCGWKVSINTNGILLDDDVIRFLLTSGISQITISLDGATPCSNDRIRGAGTYHKVIQVLAKLKKYGEKYTTKPLIQLACVLNKFNINEVEGLVCIAKEYDLDVLSISQMNITGNALSHHEQLVANPNEMIVAFCQLVDFSIQYNVRLLIDLPPLAMNFVRSIYDYDNCFDKNTPCGALTSFFYMDPEGKIFPCGNCSTTRKFKECFIDVNQASVYALDFLKSEFVTYKKYTKTSNLSNYALCLKCDYRSYCCVQSCMDLSANSLCHEIESFTEAYNKTNYLLNHDYRIVGSFLVNMVTNKKIKLSPDASVLLHKISTSGKWKPLRKQDVLMLKRLEMASIIKKDENES